MARRTGRPPIDPGSPSVSVHLRVTSHQYDRLWRDAKEEGTSVPELVRRAVLLAALAEEDPEPK